MSNYYNDQWRLPNNENKDKQSNYSMDFDGSQYIDTNLDSGSYSSFSVSAWVKGDDVNTYRTIAAQTRYGNWSNSSWLLYIEANKIAFYIVSGGSPILAGKNTVLSINQWYHIVATWDGATSKVYINGVKETTEGTVSSMNTSVVNTLIGASHNSAGTGNTGYWNGQIDGVSIFDYTLSASQVTTLYGSSSTGIGNPMSLSPKPVAYYPLGDQDAFNGANYLVPNSSLKDYVFSFDGSSSYINIASAGGIALMNTGVSSTVSLWLYPTGTGTRVFFEQNSNLGRYVIYQSGTSLFFYPNGARASFTNLILNQWYNVTTIVDGSNSKFYVNGNEVGTSTSYTPVNTLNVLEFGRYPGGTQYFEGKLSNVQVFNTALPATGSNSVETLYNNGSPLTSMTGFTSLQGWWKLDASDTYDSSTGNWTIEDHAGSNDGTSSGMSQANLVQSDLSFTSGYSPYALDFDGINDYIDIAYDTSLNLGTKATWSMWVKWDDITKLHCFASRYDSGQVSWYIQKPTAQNIEFSIGGGYNLWPISGFSGVVGEWFHLCFVYDGSESGSNKIKFYVNGTLQTIGSSAGTIPTTVPSTTSKLRIGNFSASFTTRTFEGFMSNFSLWNTDLTSAQVTELYSEGVPQNLLNHSAVSSLVSWWQLGSNSSFNTNWTVLDEKGSNNGTSVNMTEDAIVDGVGSYANGLSSGMGGDEVIGDAPYSTANSLSVNMDVEDRVTDTPS